MLNCTSSCLRDAAEEETENCFIKIHPLTNIQCNMLEESFKNTTKDKLSQTRTVQKMLISIKHKNCAQSADA